MNSGTHMNQNQSIGYRWAHGEAEEQQRLHRLMETGTAALLRQAGLREGMRVADIGCGVGLMTLRLAEEVGPAGLVVGLDEDEAQLSLARQSAEHEGRRNLWFEQASVYDTGLPRSSFGLVYARCLFSRLDRPWDALAELVTLLEPGGRLVCEEIETAPAAPVTLPGRGNDLLPATATARSGQPDRPAVPTRLSWAFGEAGLTHVGATFAQLGLALPTSPLAFGPLGGARSLALWQVWGQKPPIV